MTRVEARRGAGSRPSRGALPLSIAVTVAGVVSVLMLGCASQQKRQEPIVRDLRIEGNQNVSSRQIKSRILTAKTGWWPLASKQYFDPVSWEADLKRIVRLYGARGYYQARIAHEAVTSQEPDGVALTVTVDEGQITRVGTLVVTGLDDLPAGDREAALAGLRLKVGAPFVESDWEEAKNGLVSRLRGRGYAKAAEAGQALVDVNTRLAALTISVHPGIRYRFGGIDVKADPQGRIPTLFVWEQVRLAVPEGSTFSDEALEEAERRVFAMGVFGSVKVVGGTADDAAAVIPITAVVREGPFRTLRLGGGLTADQIHNEVHLTGDWTHRDFLGGMRKLTVHAMVGWAFIPDIYAVATNDLSVAPRSGPIFALGVTFEQPRLFGRPSLRQQTGVVFERTIEQTYDNLSSRLATGVVWQPRGRVSIYPSYHLEFDHLNGSPINSAATAPLTLGCETTTGTCNVWLSYIEEVVTWDRRDTPLEPHRGLYASVSFQQGGGPLQGDFDYLRVLPDLRGYFSFFEGNALTLAARVRVGELWPLGGGGPESSAVVIRFYSGGANSMRGFSERRLSPLLEAPAPGTKPVVYETVPIGGNGLFDGSLEARYSVLGNLRVAGFVDVGQVTTDLFTVSDLGGVLWAVGLGLRYLTPIGPIRLDVARRLPFGDLPPLYTTDPTTGQLLPPQPYAVDESCFGLFGSHPNTPVTDGACVFQLSIGEAF
jgi:translocation and assembly module TamA